MAQTVVSAANLLAQIQKRLRNGASDSAPTVIWKDGLDQVGVYVSKTRVHLVPGWLVVDVPMVSAEAGEPASVQAVFFLGRPGDQAGLSASTTLASGAPSALLDRWGRRLQVTVWNAVTDQLQASLKADKTGTARLIGFTAGQDVLQIALES